MCDACDELLKNDKEEKKDWREIMKDSGYGTRATEATALGLSDEDLAGIFETQEEEARYHYGIKCHYCDDAAEWKCLNGLHNGCSYDGPSNDGIQVCGSSSEFAQNNRSKYPEGHKSYAKEINNGHEFAPIHEYFHHDDKEGYHTRQDKRR